MTNRFLKDNPAYNAECCQSVAGKETPGKDKYVWTQIDIEALLKGRELHQVVERARRAVQVELVTARRVLMRSPARLNFVRVVLLAHHEPPCVVRPSEPTGGLPPAA